MLYNKAGYVVVENFDRNLGTPKGFDAKLRILTKKEILRLQRTIATFSKVFKIEKGCGLQCRTMSKAVNIMSRSSSRHIPEIISLMHILIQINHLKYLFFFTPVVRLLICCIDKWSRWNQRYISN